MCPQTRTEQLCHASRAQPCVRPCPPPSCTMRDAHPLGALATVKSSRFRMGDCVRAHARLRARTGEGAQIACALGEQSATRVEGVCLLNPGAGGCAGACSMRASARSRTRVCPFCVHACTASPLPHAWWPTICVRHTQRNAYCCPHAVPHAWWPTSKPGAARAMYTYRCLLPLQRPSWLRERVSAPAVALAVVVSRRWL